MADTSQFTIGTGASCGDGAVGQVSRVIVDPVAEEVIQLVIEPEHGLGGGMGVRDVGIDPGSRHVTHVLLQQGHLCGRRQEAIPIGAVAGTGDGIQLTIAKQAVQDLPPVDIDHPDRSTGS